jgi:hypothetical protein
MAKHIFTFIGENEKISDMLKDFTSRNNRKRKKTIKIAVSVLNKRPTRKWIPLLLLIYDCDPYKFLIFSYCP